VRYVIVGAGAIGGVIAARLHEHGSEVVVVARGDNYEKIRTRGLELRSPDATSLVALSAVASMRELNWRDDDTAIIAVKSQSTLEVISELSTVAPSSINIICAQNGVENERVALRYFAHTYAMCVMCPASYLSPGVVELYASPVAGVFDVGQWPRGVDEHATTFADEFTSAQLISDAVSDIELLKWGKLLSNLLNSVEALCEPDALRSDLARETYDEAVRVMAAVGISADEAAERARQRSSLVSYHQIEGRDRGGGSSWQSLARGTGDIETDYLNGEISLTGRLHAVATPFNDLLAREARRTANGRLAPGSRSAAELLALAKS
jgi:2-dehydropantoate 2-reductase